MGKSSRSSLYPEQQLLRRVSAWALKLEVNPEQVVVRPMADEWGSYSPDGVVALASDLALEEVEFQDYVIVHELLHLRYPDHGRIFQAMLAIYVPWVGGSRGPTGETDARSTHRESGGRGGR